MDHFSKFLEESFHKLFIINFIYTYYLYFSISFGYDYVLDYRAVASGASVRTNIPDPHAFCILCLIAVVLLTTHPSWLISMMVWVWSSVAAVGNSASVESPVDGGTPASFAGVLLGSKIIQLELRMRSSGIGEQGRSEDRFIHGECLFCFSHTCRSLPLLGYL